MLDVALLSSRPNFRFLLLNCAEIVPSPRSGHPVLAFDRDGNLAELLLVSCTVWVSLAQAHSPEIWCYTVPIRSDALICNRVFTPREAAEHAGGCV